LGSWLEQLILSHADRILPVDIAVARRWGQLSARLGHAGTDLLIAATALEHGLIVVTRNVRRFAPTGALVEDPFQD
jgi:predicted nucleic acid-binding protein